jgi:Domain of unknown function (DUF5069)
MTALDLRVRAPRGPRERLDGLVFMPRTIDKLRATLPGGDLGPYHVAIGLSALLLSMISVDFEALRAEVARAENDDDIAAWLRANADLSQYQRANDTLCGFRHETIPAEERTDFESLYPEYLRNRYALGFDLIEADDRELYPNLHAEAL